jgi:hypothetical protein
MQTDSEHGDARIDPNLNQKNPMMKPSCKRLSEISGEHLEPTTTIRSAGAA